MSTAKNDLLKQEEPLVSMNNVSPKIKIYPAYFMQKIPDTAKDLFLREGVAEKIIHIAKQLPSGIFFVLIDGWRSFETQRYIYERAIRQFRSLGYSEEKIKEIIVGFVAYPSKDPLKPAPHYTGAAIDLTLSNDQNWIEMGTGFDDFTERAHSDYFEGRTDLTDMELLARDHRRFLRGKMEEAGFTQNPTEWWHYSYGDRSWGKENNADPFYGGIEISK
ncbi:M15 family metallopeptidase [Sporolactobacillus pectinivorans]|uniref:M15 family metallopeptidase n=1 Tax=Sporolactobacillus pectinivorans TaxID=1591408 RepID=UPI001EFC38C8|nr:M15 family metallopeptidase [Sporolactobacillus pectinivorans]